MADPGDKKKPATYQDVLDAPEHMIAEIIGGELIVSPRPGGRHTRVASSLLYVLGPPFDRGDGGPGGWVILVEPELHLGADIVVPDIAGWRREHFELEWIEQPFIATAPDWVCEVASPRTKTHDRKQKLPIYGAAGVRHAWLVNPYYRSLEILRFDDGAWVTLATLVGVATVRAQPFDAIELDLGALWRDLPPLVPRASDGYTDEEWARIL